MSRSLTSGNFSITTRLQCWYPPQEQSDHSRLLAKALLLRRGRSPLQPPPSRGRRLLTSDTSMPVLKRSVPGQMWSGLPSWLKRQLKRAHQGLRFRPPTTGTANLHFGYPVYGVRHSRTRRHGGISEEWDAAFGGLPQPGRTSRDVASDGPHLFAAEADLPAPGPPNDGRDAAWRYTSIFIKKSAKSARFRSSQKSTSGGW
jgi:hypothetical protein